MNGVLRRIGEAVISAAGGAIIVFALLVLTPGDPARRVLAARGIQQPTLEAVNAVRAELRLDDPIPGRFWHWFSGLLTGDLGISWRTGRPVSEEFLERLPATATLTAAALILAILLSAVVGLIAASRPGGWVDHLTRMLSTAVIVVPGFLLGVVLLDLIVVRLGLGRVVADGTWRTVFLPALVLALGSAATWSRVLRAGLLEARGAPYLLVSRARGAGPVRRLFGHELPNALPPYLTMVGLGSAALLGGAPIAETVFTWPGVGRFTVEAISGRDMPVVTGFTMIAVLVYVVVSLIIDLLTAALDPRLRRTRSPRRSAATARKSPP